MKTGWTTGKKTVPDKPIKRGEWTTGKILKPDVYA